MDQLHAHRAAPWWRCDLRPTRDAGWRPLGQEVPEHLRRIRFKDPESGKTLIFLPNNTALQALTIVALYKSRWQVELFFKWIKQHLRIKRFLGTSENAVSSFPNWASRPGWFSILEGHPGSCSHA